MQHSYSEPHAAQRPLIVGEALFDAYPDGTEVLGGAPLNVAWHLQAMAVRPLLVTRIGNDPAGARLLQEMRSWGLDLGGVQMDDRLPTGRVDVTFSDHGPQFDIPPGQAFDALDRTAEVGELVGGEPTLIYHGSLITRSEDSAEAVAAYRNRTAAPVFLDVNLRAPWWSKESISRSLFGARWAKLNAEELRLLSALPVATRRSDLLVAAQRFRADHALDAIILTLGEAGAAVVLAEEVIEGRPPAVISGGDTVGAGDALCAGLISGLVRGWSWPLTLDRAMDLAAVVCSIKGATATDRDIYSRLLRDWRTS